MHGRCTLCLSLSLSAVCVYASKLPHPYTNQTKRLFWVLGPRPPQCTLCIYFPPRASKVSHPLAYAQTKTTQEAHARRDIKLFSPSSSQPARFAMELFHSQGVGLYLGTTTQS